ncbi:MAG: PQ-loop domain-containing transporter [Candidatus Jorgensenbacteria bacterium]|nr:PQ-loop domain-containing transporter [Candidatus Jorgensenbacteria bacterium]
MFDWIVETLRETVEWKEWGWNMSTFGAMGALATSSLQGMGLWKQGRRIWRDRAAPTISLALFWYSMWYFFAFLVYGIQGKSATMVLASSLAFIHLPIVIGVMRYGRVSRYERWSLYVLPFMVPLMVVAGLQGFREELFFGYLLGIIGFLVPQVYRAWKSPSPKDLDPFFIVAFLLTSVFWFIYAFVADSWALKIFNPLAFIFWCIMLALWWTKVKMKEEKKEDDPGVVLIRIMYVFAAVLVIMTCGVLFGIAYLAGVV